MSTKSNFEKRLSIYEFFHGICFWCGRKCLDPHQDFSESEPLFATVDHVIPRGTAKKKGGQSLTKVLACFECNQLRSYYNTSLWKENIRKENEMKNNKIARLAEKLTERDIELARLRNILYGRLEFPWYMRLWYAVSKYFANPQQELESEIAYD